MHPWRSRLERWFTPLARRCPLSPNAITILALGLSLIAAILIASANTNPLRFLLALPILAIGGLLDAFDGIVARVRGSESRFGDFLDHTCDRVSDLALIAAWCIGGSIRLPLAFCTVIAVALVGYLGTQIEATFRVRTYDNTGRGEFVLAMFILPLLAYLTRTTGLGVAGPLSLEEWCTSLLLLTAVNTIIQRLRMASRLSRSPQP